MHAAWFTAAVPDAPTVVLKLRLRPYCLGHEILLTRLGSPFVSGLGSRPQTPTPDDLVLAVLICSQTWEGALRAIHSPFLTLLLRFWRWRLRRKAKGSTLNSKTNSAFSLQPSAFPQEYWSAETLAFMAYRQAGLWKPECNRPKTAGHALKAPWPFTLLMLLMRELHFAESAALNYPITKANVLFAAHGDLEGRIDLFGPADQAMLDKIDEMDARQAEVYRRCS